MDQDNNYISRDRSCKEFSIEFSCVYLIQGSLLKSTLRLLSCKKYLVGTQSVETERLRSKESAIAIRLSLMEE